MPRRELTFLLNITISKYLCIHLMHFQFASISRQIKWLYSISLFKTRAVHTGLISRTVGWLIEPGWPETEFQFSGHAQQPIGKQMGKDMNLVFGVIVQDF